MEWSVIAEPTNDGRNGDGEWMGGLAVKLMALDSKGHEHQHLVSNVAYNRRISASPDVSFVDALEAEFTKAEAAAEVLNDALDAMERAESERVLELRERIREILGEPAKVPA
jgi:hypothetical protein